MTHSQEQFGESGPGCVVEGCTENITKTPEKEIEWFKDRRAMSSP